MLSQNYPNIFALGLVHFHIMAGFLAMFSGLVPWFTPKGGRSHRVYGIVFVVSMGLASLTGIPLGLMFGHAYQIILSLFGLCTALAGWAMARESLSGLRSRAQWLNPVLAAIAFTVTLVFPSLYSGVQGSVILIYSSWIILATVVTLVVKGDQRRFVQHFVLTTTALVLAWAAYFNTQLHRFTDAPIMQDVKMAIPLLFALLPIIWMSVKWSKPQPEAVDSAESPWKEQFKVVSKGEGISLLLLLFVAVPLKRLADYEVLVTVLGPIHGTLTMVYGVLTLLLWRVKEVNLKQGFILLACSLIPFGWLLAEKVLARAEKAVA